MNVSVTENNSLARISAYVRGKRSWTDFRKSVFASFFHHLMQEPGFKPVSVELIQPAISVRIHYSPTSATTAMAFWICQVNKTFSSLTLKKLEALLMKPLNSWSYHDPITWLGSHLLQPQHLQPSVSWIFLHQSNIKDRFSFKNITYILGPQN